MRSNLHQQTAAVAANNYQNNHSGTAAAWNSASLDQSQPDHQQEKKDKSITQQAAHTSTAMQGITRLSGIGESGGTLQKHPPLVKGAAMEESKQVVIHQLTEQLSTQSTIHRLSSEQNGRDANIYNSLMLGGSKHDNIHQVAALKMHLESGGSLLQQQTPLKQGLRTEGQERYSSTNGKGDASKRLHFPEQSLQPPILSNGEETSTSSQGTLNKKPQFQFVCMEPTKEQNGKSIKHYSISHKDNRNAQLIDPGVLSRILKLQQLQRSSTGGGSIHSGQGHISGGGQRYYNNNGYEKGRPIMLDIDRIGICGIPSLWVPKEELVSKNQLFREHQEEQQRLELMFRILQSHKKYENDKYFGGSVFKRGQGQNSGVQNGGQSSQTANGNLSSTAQNGGGQLIPMSNGLNGQSPEFVWFSIDNLAKIKMIADKGSLKEETLEQVQILPQLRVFEQSEALTFKTLQAEAKLVRLILESHGFVQTESNDWNILWTCTSSLQKQYIYENLHEYQKINHFINALELTRKDRLCYNVGKMQQKFGRSHFDFLPETYILPDEYPEFQKQFNQKKHSWSEEGEAPKKSYWIVKPSSSSQGKGIFMVDDSSEVPLNESMVISQYIDNPLLINGLKFDLRLYVLVTNFDPLKIYVYNEGLVRFASEPYNIESIKSNVYAHLTNYSINKKSENFIQNKNLSERDFGNKWSLSALQSHLERLGVDMKPVWARIYDAIIKSIISVEGQIVAASKKIQNASGSSIKQNCFDLFGFDIILDSDLKPWILEVNLSPSLAFDSPLDFHIKSNLLIDALNIVGIRKFNRKKDATGKYLPNGKKPSANSQPTVNQQTSQGANVALGTNQSDQKKKNNAQSTTSQQSQSQLNKSDFTGMAEQKSQNIDIQHMERLSKISAKHRELLREHLEEFCMIRPCFSPVQGTTVSLLPSVQRRHNFTRIYPAPGSNSYDMYFQAEATAQQQQQSSQPKQWNKILYRYLYDRSSELQDIINQLNRQTESQRRASQGRTNAQLSHQTLQQKETEQQTLEQPKPTPVQEQQTANGGIKNNESAVISQEPSNPPQRAKLLQPIRAQSSMSNNQGSTPDNNDSSNIASGLKTINHDPNNPISPLHHSEAKKRAHGSYLASTCDLPTKQPDSQLKASPMKDSQFSTHNNLLQQVEQLNPSSLHGRVQTTKPSLSQNSDKKDHISSRHQQEAPKILPPQHISAQGQQHDQRIVVTGDDILIEYVRRIMNLTRQCQTQQIDITPGVLKKLEQFIGHKIWQPREDRKANPVQQFQSSNVISGPQLTLWQKIENRFTEMGDRKRRLFVKKYQQENKGKYSSEAVSNDQLEKLFRQQEKQKADIVREFSSQELELMLMQSNKNNPIEVVTLLLSLGKPLLEPGTPGSPNESQSNGGVLTALESDHQRRLKSNSSLIKVKSSQSHQHADSQQTESGFGGDSRKKNYSSSKDRSFQSSGLNRLKSCDEQPTNPQPRMSLSNGGGNNFGAAVNSDYYSNQSQQNYQTQLSSDSIKTASVYQTTHHASGILGMQAASHIHSLHPQGTATHSTISNLGGSHTSLLANLHNQKQQQHHSQQKQQSSHSKIKNQASTFDRCSDIALQTGLALTQSTIHKLNASDAEQQKKITLPAIANHNIVINNGGAQDTIGTTQYTSTGGVSNSSVSVISQKGGVSNHQSSSYLQNSYHQHQTLQNYLTQLGGVPPSSQQSSGVESAFHTQSKYRQNKIKGAGGTNIMITATSKTPAGGGGVEAKQQQMMTNHLRGGTTANTIVSGGGVNSMVGTNVIGNSNGGGGSMGGGLSFPASSSSTQQPNAGGDQHNLKGSTLNLLQNN